MSSGVLELFEELAGDVALEASADFAVRFAFGASSLGVGAGALISAQAGEHDDVEYSVELSVAGPVEAMPVG